MQKQYQMSVNNAAYNWAQRKTGQKQPSTFLNDILIQAMIKDIAESRVVNQKVVYDQQPVDLDQDNLAERWTAVGLEHPDPIDPKYNEAMEWLKSCYSSE